MINLYKEISKEILKILEADNIEDIKLVENFNKRQELIDSLSLEELSDFKRAYSDEKVYKLDKEIKFKLGQQMIATKKAISEFKVGKKANSVYANMNKNNLNIFLKKV
ncbi:hypothetical protein ABFP60_08420 [Clostridioides difficile]